MYATCLFCHAALGANESIEHFPVGKRLAYDAAKGRLWVVCPKCDRWNLSPLEERWEAIEEAERVYRDTKKRVATDNVGLARLADGTDLIRIGAPLREEFASWRYGETFGKRRKLAYRNLIFASLVGTGVSRFDGHFSTMAAAGVFALQIGVQMGVSMVLTRRMRVSVKDDGGRIRQLSHGEAYAARYELDNETGAPRVLVASGHGAEFRSSLHRGVRNLRALTAFAHEDRLAIQLTGMNALRALSNLMPSVNVGGGSEKEVSQAIALVETSNSPERLFRELATGKHRGRWQLGKSPNMICRVTPDVRLALEMSLHEADERRAMDGELHELEQRWKDAEEIAHIADGLTLPEGMNESLDALRRNAEPASSPLNSDAGP